MAPTSLDAHKPRIRIGEYKLVGLLALFLVGGPLIGLLVLATSHEQWLPPLQAMGSSAAPLFVLTASVLAGLCLIPTHAASLVGGLLFGAFAGSAWALTAVVGAALLGFLLLRAVVSGWAAAMIERHPGALSVQRALLRSGRLRAIGIIALVRLSPVMPFGGTNLLVVVGGGKLAEFLIGSVVGLSPRVVAVAIAGAGLAELDFDRPNGVWFAVLGAAATVAALFVIGRIARRALRRATGDSNASH